MTDQQPRQRGGGCRCGAIRYLAEGDPLWVAHCHCESCRRATGTALVTYAGYAHSQVTFTEGRPAGYASSPGVVRSFCATCGTPIAYQGDRWSEEIHLLLCTLDDPESLEPQGHVYVAEQLRWLKLADGLPRHAGTSSQADSPDPGSTA